MSLVPRISPSVGAYAELFVVAVLGFGLAGAGWGMWRPTMNGVITEGGGVEITDPALANANIEFASFGVMALALAALGIALACYGVIRLRRDLSPGLLWWGALSAFAGSLMFYVVGSKVAFARVGVPPEEQLHVGASISYLPDLNLGVLAGVAPFLCVLGLWLAALAMPERSDTHPDAA